MKNKVNAIISRLFDKEQVPVLLPKRMGIFVGEVESLLDSETISDSQKEIVTREKEAVVKEVQEMKSSLTTNKELLAAEFGKVSNLAKQAGAYFNIAKDKRSDNDKESLVEHLFQMASLSHEIMEKSAEVNQYVQLKPLVQEANRLYEYINLVGDNKVDHKELKIKLKEIEELGEKQKRALDVAVDDIIQVYEQEIVLASNAIVSLVNASEA